MKKEQFDLENTETKNCCVGNPTEAMKMLAMMATDYRYNDGSYSKWSIDALEYAVDEIYKHHTGEIPKEKYDAYKKIINDRKSL